MGKSWLDKVVNAYSENEAPERFFWWSALATISATIRKRVYLNRFYYKLYPNIYVLLVSTKSGLKKGIPIAMASDLMNEVQCTKVIAGRNTIEAVVKELSLQRTLENGLVLNDAQSFLISDEFRAFLHSNDDALTILTALHNTHEHKRGWSNTLKNSPVESLKNPCVTMLTASNEALLEDILQTKDIEGGFIARTFVIHESKRARVNALVDEPTVIIPISELAEHLKKVAKLEGEFLWPRDSKDFYKSWYEKLCSLDVRDRTGTFDRLGDQVLKAGMNIALSKRTDGLVLLKEDLEEAIDKAEGCTAGTLEISAGQGKSEIAGPSARVLKELVKAPDHELSRQRILKRCWPDVDHITLDKVIDYLEAAKAITSFRDHKQGVMYKMTEEKFTQYRKWKEEEN